MMGNFSLLKKLFHLLQWQLLLCLFPWVFWSGTDGINQLFRQLGTCTFLVIPYPILYLLQPCSVPVYIFSLHLAVYISFHLVVYGHFDSVVCCDSNKANVLFSNSNSIFVSCADTLPLGGFPHKDTKWNSMVVVCFFCLSQHSY